MGPDRAATAVREVAPTGRRSADPRSTDRRRWLGRSIALAAGALGAGALGGCGFRPRGSGSGPGVAGSVFVDADRGLSVLPELREALLERGFTLAPNRDEAELLLRVGGERVAERIVSVQSTGRVSEYELLHEVNLLIAPRAGEGPPAYPADALPNRVGVTREYTWDVTEVLGKANEARILKLELRRELVRQVVLRTLASLVVEPGGGAPEPATNPGTGASPPGPDAAGPGADAQSVGSSAIVEANAREV